MNIRKVPTVGAYRIRPYKQFGETFIYISSICVVIRRNKCDKVV